MRFMTSIGLTIPYITLKILVLIEDYIISKFYINVYTDMLQMIEASFSNCSLVRKIIVQWFHITSVRGN
jgi:hypothetical protein